MNPLNPVFKNLSIAEYLLIVQPMPNAYEAITEVKKVFAKKFDCAQALYSKPHITLINFVQLEMQEHKCIKILQQHIVESNSFLIKLNGFGSFPTHTIYAQVETKNNLIELVKSLKPVQQILKLDKEHKPHFITEPHVTIARKLQPWQYEKAWIEYSGAHFTTSFMVNKLLLLKRKIEQKHYTVAATFELLGKKKIVAEQVSLF